MAYGESNGNVIDELDCMHYSMATHLLVNSYVSTRKLCYRKDDRAMRHIHGCLKIFGTP